LRRYPSESLEPRAGLGRRVFCGYKINTRNNMTKRTKELIQRICALGFTVDEAWQLRRIEMTLHRWGEQECGDSNDHCSWSIERDEATGKPFRVVHPHSGGKSRREAVADREAGALKRLHLTVAARNFRVDPVGSGDGRLQYYHQADPRGCALYLLRASDVRLGERLDEVYSRGLAACE